MGKEEYLNDFIGKDFNFDMYTVEGNNKVKEIILEALNKIFYDKSVNRKKIINLIQHRLDKAYKEELYKNIKDTEPKTHIVEQVNKAADKFGIGCKISRFSLK
tara:strand:+ start:1949 stop:2257 length:309 start_codon:yes stop_codon:yes gene_type:complete